MKLEGRQIMMRWLIWLLLIALVIVSTGRAIPSLAASTTSSGAVKEIAPREKDAVPIGYVATSAEGGLPWIAKGGGLFTKYGLDVSLTFLNARTLTAALIGDSVAVAYGSFVSIPAAVVEGADLVIIGASYQGPIFSMVASRNVGRIENLRGKKIGILTIGGTSDAIARKVVIDLGMKPDKDVAILAMGENMSIVAGLQNGAIDAAVLAEPFTSLAVSSGFPIIYDQSQSGQKSLGIPLTVRRKYLKSHEEVLTRFLKANLEAIHLMKTDPDKASQYISNYLAIKDTKVLRSSVVNVSRITDKDLGIPMEDLKEKLLLASKSNPGVAKLKAEDLIDVSLLEKIKASGFIAELYK